MKKKFLDWEKKGVFQYTNLLTELIVFQSSTFISNVLKNIKHISRKHKESAGDCFDDEKTFQENLDCINIVKSIYELKAYTRYLMQRIKNKLTVI